MIAKRIPPIAEQSGKRRDVAAAYGLTVEEFSAASYDFLQCEGADDSGEYETLHDWLTRDHWLRRDNTPYQKGDAGDPCCGEK